MSSYKDTLNKSEAELLGLEKGNANVNDLVKVFIKDAKGISLRGELISEVKAA